MVNRRNKTLTDQDIAKIAGSYHAWRGEGVGAYAVGNTIYACGGGWVSYYDSCETYDTTQGYSGSWDIQPDIMLQGRRTFGTTNIGPVLYAIGGWNGNYLQTAERRSFDNFLPLTLK